MTKINLILFLAIISCLLCSCVKNKESKHVVVLDSINSNSTRLESESYLNLKARLAYESNDYLSASKLYSLLILKDSTKGDFFFKKGICCAKLGFKDDAIDNFQKSVCLNFRISDSYFNISLAYASLLNDSLALVYINKCISLSPNDKDAKEIVKGFIKISKQKKKGKNVDL